MKTKNPKYTSSNKPEHGRLAPQALDCEDAVIGALLIERRSFDVVAPMLKPEMFYRPANQIIYRAICELNKENSPIDMITVVEKLKKNGDLETVGGVYAITLLTTKVSSSAHIEYHSRIIVQKFLARELISVTSRIQEDAFDDTQDIDDVLSDAERHIIAIREGSVDASGMLRLSDLLYQSHRQMYERIEKAKHGEQRGINTGLADLNKVNNGWQKGELTIIAARPAMGKTAFALHFAKSAAQRDTPVAVFSLEMTGVSLSNRLILSEADIDPDGFKSGRISDAETNEVEKAIGRLERLPIYVDDNSIATISKIKAKARLLKKRGQCEMIIIDYLQLAEGEDKFGNREQEIASISRGAKKMAKELDVPVILLSQLSRAVELRESKIPQLSDLRESGAIEQDADMVIFLYRPEYYGKFVHDETGNDINNYVELIVAKYREGATGTVKATHNGSLTKIYDFDYRGYRNSAPPVNIPVNENNNMPF